MDGVLHLRDRRGGRIIHHKVTAFVGWKHWLEDGALPIFFDENSETWPRRERH